MSDLNPARLAEIEATYPIEVPVPEYSNGPIGPAVVIHELIAEIRRLNDECRILEEYGQTVTQRNIKLEEESERWTKRG